MWGENKEYEFVVFSCWKSFVLFFVPSISWSESRNIVYNGVALYAEIEHKIKKSDKKTEAIESFPVLIMYSILYF